MISGRLYQTGRSVVGAATAVVTMVAKVKLHDVELRTTVKFAVCTDLRDYFNVVLLTRGTTHSTYANEILQILVLPNNG